MNQQNKIFIAKFGGTSVADFEAMNKCADIIIANPDTRIVVLSASADVTNLLIELAGNSAPKIKTEAFDTIKAIQYAILTKLANNESIKREIDRQLQNIASLSEAAGLAMSNALTDELTSYGEIMSTLLFTEIMKQKGVNVKWFDIREVMYTDDSFGKAIPDLTTISHFAVTRLQPELANAVIITQGFIGREASGKTTTLGRGGSDYTAALLGEALKSPRIDIWTDVTGIFTTDPKVVPNAMQISEITFEEAAEMATFGAKILHPATLVPAMRANIPVFVGSSKTPDIGGTIIYSNVVNPPLFRAIALRKQQILLTLHSLNMLHARRFLAKVFSILANYHVSVDLITTSEVSVALTLDTTGTDTDGKSLLTDALLYELSQLCRVEIEKNLSLVALIGNQLTQSKGVGNYIFNVLNDINIRMTCYGASSHNICLLVDNEQVEQVVQRLHKKLFE